MSGENGVKKPQIKPLQQTGRGNGRGRGQGGGTSGRLPNFSGTRPTPCETFGRGVSSNTDGKHSKSANGISNNKPTPIWRHVGASSNLSNPPPLPLSSNTPITTSRPARAGRRRVASRKVVKDNKSQGMFPCINLSSKESGIHDYCIEL